MDSKHIEDKFNTQNRRLNDHGERIDKLEQFQASSMVEIRNLVEQVKSLVSAIKWAGTITVGTLLSFFIWYIQNLR